MNILREYDRIMQQEARLHESIPGVEPFSSRILTIPATEMRWYTERIAEVAKNSLVPRSYISHYHVDRSSDPESTVAFESDGAHVNLMSAMVDRAIEAYYGADFGEPDGAHPRTADGWSHKEIIEAIRNHDLPENITGDLPDNSSRNEAAKTAAENAYYKEFIAKYPHDQQHFAARAIELIEHMGRCDTPTGRLLKVADKCSAIFITLTYNSVGRTPMMHLYDPKASQRDIEEMRECDYVQDGFRKASEMWTLDHFTKRKTILYDDTGFFTAIIVMYTLMVEGKWYSWRERTYHA